MSPLVLLSPLAGLIYGTSQLFKSDEEKAREQRVDAMVKTGTLIAGVGIAAAFAVYAGYKASGAGDE